MSPIPFTSRLLRRWHKCLGLSSAIFLAFMALSGFMLNHGNSFNLDSTDISTPWLMSWYGLEPLAPDQCFQEKGLLFCSQGDIWVLTGHRLKSGHGEPIGAIRVAEQIWIATADEIYIYDLSGQPIDKIERGFLPRLPIHRLGTRNGALVANVGSSTYVTGDGLSWKRLPDNANINWSKLSSLVPEQKRKIAPLFAPSLPLQRIVADVHSGRILGRFGVYLTDILGGILILLSCSGLWLYFGTKNKKN